MGASRENAFTNVRATRRAAPRWPELNAGCPQQTCAAGKSTSKPACAQEQLGVGGRVREQQVAETRREELDALHARDSTAHGSSAPLERAPCRPHGPRRRLPQARGRPRARRVQVARCAARARALPATTARPASSRPPPAITAPPQRGRRSSSALPRPSTLPEGASRDEARQALGVRGRGRRDRRRLRRGEGQRPSAYADGAGLPVLRGRRRAGAARRLRGDRRRDPRPAGRGARGRRRARRQRRAARRRRPRTRRPLAARRGASASSRPARRSWPGRGVRAGAVDCDLCDTIADGLAVRVAIPSPSTGCWRRPTRCSKSPKREIAAAVVAFDDAGIRAEAAAAAALAALPRIEADGPIVLVVTGRNIDDELLARCRAQSWTVTGTVPRTRPL